MDDAYVCAFVRESTGMPQEMSAQLWKFGVSPWRLPWVCVYGSLFPSLQPGWTGSPGWHDNLLLPAEPSQAPRLLDDSKHPFRNSFSLCSSSWLGTSYVDQTDLTQGATCLPLLVSAGITVWSTNCRWSPPCSLRQGISFCRALRCCSSG